MMQGQSGWFKQIPAILAVEISQTKYSIVEIIVFHSIENVNMLHFK